MTFFLDENFPRSATPLLVKLGHLVVDARDVAAPGTDDRSLFAMAQDVSGVLLTTDRDFFHTVPSTYAEHAGVIVIALRQPNRARILTRLEWLLVRVGERDFPGHVYQLRDNNYFVRHP